MRITECSVATDYIAQYTFGRPLLNLIFSNIRFYSKNPKCKYRHHRQLHQRKDPHHSNSNHKQNSPHRQPRASSIHHQMALHFDPLHCGFIIGYIGLWFIAHLTVNFNRNSASTEVRRINIFLLCLSFENTVFFQFYCFKNSFMVHSFIPWRR